MKKNKNGWIKTSEQVPEFLKGRNHSANVLAIEKGLLRVMCYIKDGSFVYWANCYGEIDGDAYSDGDYQPTHWQHLPSLETE